MLADATRPGVQEVRRLRMRWIGHRLHADLERDVDPMLTLTEARRVAHDAEHELTHGVPKLSTAVNDAYPADHWLGGRGRDRTADRWCVKPELYH